MNDGLAIGDLVRVMDHHLEGHIWTVGMVGCIVSQAHEQDFSALWGGHVPIVKSGWWTVSVDHMVAKGGFAFAVLPEEILAPHACASECDKHPCQGWRG